MIESTTLEGDAVQLARFAACGLHNGSQLTVVVSEALKLLQLMWLQCIVIRGPVGVVCGRFGKIRDVVEFIKEHSISKIDLLKMNIEGGEYELLDRLITTGEIKKCKNIQIQFHNYGEWSILKRDQLKDELRKTHFCTYDFEWTFEGWQLIESFHNNLNDTR